MVDFFNLDDVNDRDWDVNIDRDVDIVYFVKAERGDFLVVVLLVLKKDQGNVQICHVRFPNLYFVEEPD